jgi:hypothetical protein
MSTSTGTETNSRWLTALCWVLAVLALGGAAGLITGVIDLGESATDRLPMDSPVLAGAALALVVGAPMTVAGWRTQLGTRNSAPTAFVAGVLLAAWVLVQPFVIGEFSVPQPLMFVAGAGVAVLAFRSFPKP